MCPLPMVVIMKTPVTAIVMPAIFFRVSFSCKKIKDRKTVNIGENEISQPASDAWMVSRAVA
ncbi:hypothetical protein HFA01_37130 [Halobacillus faecis]|uniref:Uncharacterized protein n=1 Tax=Halobacillus faecis TaxID=360184 RepID=A0A511WYE3_9BACI|nr:hypothetical protein HFA01_37130 [Halobacillus faecis]